MDFIEYFRNKDLTKIPKVGIHYEQKTTPDLLWCVSLVILDITKDDRIKIFSDTDVRSSAVFNSLMQDYFSKAPQEQAEDEYNKVSSYQLGVLTYAGVLEQMETRPKRYKIVDLSILEYIAINDLNACKFLAEYTEKFLNDNGFSEIFNIYRLQPTQDNYVSAKNFYWNWAKINTAVRTENHDHTFRVFNKIFNIYCYKNRIPGEGDSNISPGPCPYSFLIYNRENFRDKNLPVGMTRQQYHEEILTDIEQDGVVETLIQKAKDNIRQKYNNDSEIKDQSLGYTINSGVHVHHIFPKYSFPQFSLSKENLIALTPGQHLSFAHVRANTKTINPQFQLICLKTKFNHIKESIHQNENFYELTQFIKMLNTGLGWSLAEDSTIDIVASRLE